MRCRKCGQPAAFNMPQHRLALCKTHYPEWFVEQTEKTIHKYRMITRQDRILVAVSGGKDSLNVMGCFMEIGLPGGWFIY